jgi:hypothetical protein
MPKWELAKLAFKNERYMDAMYYANFCFKQNCLCGKDISIIRKTNGPALWNLTTPSQIMKKGSEKTYENN